MGAKEARELWGRPDYEKERWRTTGYDAGVTFTDEEILDRILYRAYKELSDLEMMYKQKVSDIVLSIFAFAKQDKKRYYERREQEVIRTRMLLAALMKNEDDDDDED